LSIRLGWQALASILQSEGLIFRGRAHLISGLRPQVAEQWLRDVAPSSFSQASSPCEKVTFLLCLMVNYRIEFYSARVELDVVELPAKLLARYFALVDRMVEHGPNLGEPHTKAMGDGLFELRLKSAEGIARVFYCTIVQRRIVMLNCFVKKTQKTPRNELQTARNRMKELRNGNV
jgi:phage-related protein